MFHQRNTMDHLIVRDNYIKKVELQVYVVAQESHLSEVEYFFQELNAYHHIGVPTFGVYFCTYDCMQRALTPEGSSYVTNSL